MDLVDSIVVPHKIELDNVRLIGDRPIEITITDDTEKAFFGLGKSGGGFTLRKDAFELWRPHWGTFDGPKFRREDIVRGYIVVLFKYI